MMDCALCPPEPFLFAVGPRKTRLCTPTVCVCGRTPAAASERQNKKSFYLYTSVPSNVGIHPKYIRRCSSFAVQPDHVAQHVQKELYNIRSWL